MMRYHFPPYQIGKNFKDPYAGEEMGKEALILTADRKGAVLVVSINTTYHMV